jgi:hypothetical protein
MERKWNGRERKGGRPIVAVSADRKLDGFLAQIGLEWYLSCGGPDELGARLEAAMRNLPSVDAELERFSDRQRPFAGKVTSLAAPVAAPGG